MGISDIEEVLPVGATILLPGSRKQTDDHRFVENRSDQPTNDEQKSNFKESSENTVCEKTCLCDYTPLDFRSFGQKLTPENKEVELYKSHYCIKLKKSVDELQNCSLTQLTILLDILSQAAEAMSSQLVQLLLENDSLRQESDARNIAIEQLLKITVHNPDNELKPVQMSVILPEDEEEVET